MTRHYMKAFREARQAMGFVQTSAFVPTSKIEEFSLYVDRLRAERMEEICEKALPTSRERRAVAGRNLTASPTVDEVKQLSARNRGRPAIGRLANKLIERLQQANAALNVARMEDDEEDMIKWMSWAVAHNHMASVMWRELVHAEKQMEESGD